MNQGRWSVALSIAVFGALVLAQASGTGDQWRMRQRDPQHTGRADFVFPVSRDPASFFDVVLWQKPSPNAPDEGFFGASQMVFYDGSGPGGADIVLGTYHWPKGVMGLDRHTGAAFWSGLPDGGESIADRTPAFSGMGDVVYVSNDATDGHPLMAFPTTDGPAAYWHNGSNPNPEHLGMVSPVVTDDGRIFMHDWISRPYAAWDAETELIEVWGAATHLEMGLSDVSVYEEGSYLVVATARDSAGIKGFDGETGDELWTVDTPPTDAAATIDPETGNIYVGAGFNSTWVVGLDQYGQPLWDETAKEVYSWVPGENAAHWSGSSGCLSWDGSTYYFQTASEYGEGLLYAINTADGSVKWTYATHSIGWDGNLASPIVTQDGVIVVGNNGGRTFYALRDVGTAAVLMDTLEVSEGGEAYARGSATIASDGIMYLALRTRWTAGNGDGDTIRNQVSNVYTAFDLREGAVPRLWPPAWQRAFSRNAAVLVKWQPVTSPDLDHYAIYREEYPFTSVEGLVPVGTVADPTVGEYLDGTAQNGTPYYYAITCVSIDGSEYRGVSSHGPRTPFDETDVQVVSIERTPLYPNYDVTTSWESIVEPSGFGPYWYERATGLGSGQDEFTQRWPNDGDEVTYTATIRNRGTNAWSGVFPVAWTIDGVPSWDSVSMDLDPGQTMTFDLVQTWDGGLHSIEFLVEADDARVGNDYLAIDSKSISMLTAIDASTIEEFREDTPNWPGAVTDDAVDHLNHAAQRMSAMFAEQGSQRRVHFGVIQVLDDPDPDPAVDPLLHVSWPDRWRAGSHFPLRGSAGYSDADDVDYQLINWWGRLIGLAPSDALNITPESNQVSFTGFTGPIGVMNASPWEPYFAAHSALGMQGWLDIVPGYRGEYMYDMPLQVQVRVLDHDGLPLPGAEVTVYQTREWGGKQLTRDVVKARGVTGVDGVFELPGVSLDPTRLPQTFIGAALHDNPFGYLDREARNGLLLLKIEKDGYADFAWLDVTEVNLAYWAGATVSATFDRSTALGGPVEVCTPDDMAERNASEWSAWGGGGAGFTISDNGTIKDVGEASIQVNATGGFENWIRYPEGHLANWDLTHSDVLRFRLFHANDQGFQDSPGVRLIGPDGYIDLRYNGALGDLMGQAYGQWFEIEVPLAGNFAWDRSEHGSVSLSEIHHLELFADTWGYGYTLWIDGVMFDPAPRVPPAAVRVAGTDPSTIAWLAVPGAETYDVGRGLVSALGPGQYGPCLADDIDALSLEDAEVPPGGESFFYLVRGNVPGCTANWGHDSAGNERTNHDPAGCP
ncbi:MAG: hypothetical protein KBD01_03280 [Acidobacteria bacterium]|nr:hypothetical protein [Acidobacteriota bacterium]